MLFDLVSWFKHYDAVQLGQGFFITSCLIKITSFRKQILGAGARVVCRNRNLSHQSGHVVAIQHIAHAQRNAVYTLRLLPFGLPFCIGLQIAPRLVVGRVGGFSLARLLQRLGVKEVGLAIPRASTQRRQINLSR